MQFCYVATSLLILSLSGCDQIDMIDRVIKKEYSESNDNNGHVSISEKMSFDERFNLNIILPLPDIEFLSLMSNLDVRIYKRGAGQKIPLPKSITSAPDLNMESIQHGYWIYVPRTENSTYTEAYIALVNYDNNVNYIVSNFQYDEPAF